MGSQRVDSIFDTAAIQDEYDAVVVNLSAMKAAILDLNNQRVAVKGADLTAFTAAQKQLSDAINQVNTATTKATTAANGLNSAQKAQAAATKTAAAEAKANAKIQDDLANTYKQLSLAARDASLRAKNYSLDLGANHPITKEATADALAMNTKLKELDATTGVYNRNVGNYSSALTGYANTLRGLRGPTKLLGEALGIGAQEADQFRLVIEHSLQGIAAYFRGKEAKAAAEAEDAAATGANTAAVEANTIVEGQNMAATTGATVAIERQTIAEGANVPVTEALAVGTEVAAAAEVELAVATTAASTALRIFKFAIAATGIGLLLVGLGYIVYRLIEFNKSLSSVSEQQKALNEINAEAVKGLGEQVVKISLLQTKLNDLNISQQDRKKYIKEYNVEADKGNKIDADQINNIGQINILIARQIELIKDRAIAKAAENYVSKAADKLFEAQAKLEDYEAEFSTVSDKSLQVQLDKAQSLLDTSAKNRGIAAKLNAKEALAFIDLPDDQLNIAIQNNRGKLEVLSNDALKTQLRLIQRNAKLITDAQSGTRAATGAGFIKGQKENVAAAQAEFDKALALASTLINPDTFAAKKEKKAAAEKLDTTKATINSEFELYKIAQTEKIKILDEDVKNEKLSFDKRIIALNNYNDARISLIDAQAAEDINKLNQQEAVLEGNRKKAKGVALQNIVIELKNIETKKLEIGAAAAVAEREVLRENEAGTNAFIDDIAKKRFKDQKDQYDKFILLADEFAAREKAALDKGYTESTEALKTRYDAGKISLSQYNQKRLGLDYAYAIASLQVEIDKDKKIIAAKAIFGLDVSKEQAALAKLEKEVAADGLKFTTDTEKAKQEKIISTLNTIKDVSAEVFKTIDGFMDASLTNQKNALQELSDADEAKAARDIEIVNASTQTEEQKAAAIIIINARLAAQKDQIAQRERAAEVQKAKFDKATAIFNIILSTATAVIKSLPGGLVTGLTYAIAAMGAAELAVAIKTPIPKYKGGRGEGKEEFAYVHAGEFIHRSNGDIQATPAVESLTHLMPKDKVYPSKKAMMRELGIGAFPLSNYQVNKDGGITKKDMEQMTGRIEGAVSNIRIHTTEVNKAGWREHNRRLSEYDKWVNKYVKH